MGPSTLQQDLSIEGGSATIQQRLLRIENNVNQSAEEAHNHMSEILRSLQGDDKDRSDREAPSEDLDGPTSF